MSMTATAQPGEADRGVAAEGTVLSQCPDAERHGGTICREAICA